MFFKFIFELMENESMSIFNQCVFCLTESYISDSQELCLLCLCWSHYRVNRAKFLWSMVDLAGGVKVGVEMSLSSSWAICRSRDSPCPCAAFKTGCSASEIKWEASNGREPPKCVLQFTFLPIPAENQLS